MNFIFPGNWWNELSFPQQIFWTIALIFTILFVLQLVLSILGMDFDSDVDGDFSGDIGGGIEASEVDGHFDVDSGFTLFSVRSIIAFFLFFGWVGVITLSNGVDLKTAIIVSSLAGIISLFFVAFVLFQLVRLAETGSPDIENALGKYGKVYIPIPAKRSSTGMVHIELDNRLMELRAVTDGNILPTGTLVYVFKILEDNVLLVGEIKDK